MLSAVAHDAAADIGLPVRFLPNMPLIHFYWLLVSSWDNVQAMTIFPGSRSLGSQGSRNSFGQAAASYGVPSYPTFRRRYGQVWGKYLVIRTASQHAQCQTCWELQQKINQRGSMTDKLKAVRALGQHYADQYADRCLYWALRHASRMRDNVIVIIIDSMDKAKFAWPRFPWARMPKGMDGISRPRLSLTAAIAHGYITNFFLSSERVNHGPDCFMEQVFTTVQDVQELCQERGWEMPEHLVIQADNTVAQCKNTWANLGMAYLVATRKFKTVTMNYLLVGHTHEDIDHLFGIIVNILIMKISFETPAEMLAHILERMTPRIQRRHERCKGYMLRAVRDWSNWLFPIQKTLFNGFGNRGGIEAAHSFAYVSRCEMSEAMQRALEAGQGGPGVQGNDDDVLCIVKAYMRDTTPNQPPLLVLDQSDVMKVATRVPETVVPLHALSVTEVRNHLTLASILEDMGMHHAAKGVA